MICKNDLIASELEFLFSFLKSVNDFSDADSKWAEWVLAHPEFRSSVNPIITKGADFAHCITACPPGLLIIRFFQLLKCILLVKTSLEMMHRARIRKGF